MAENSKLPKVMQEQKERKAAAKKSKPQQGPPDFATQIKKSYDDLTVELIELQIEEVKVRLALGKEQLASYNSLNERVALLEDKIDRLIEKTGSHFADFNSILKWAVEDIRREQKSLFKTFTPAMASNGEEKCNIFLTRVGPKRINVIKEIRTFTGLGLREAKDLVDRAEPYSYNGESIPEPGAPQMIAQDISLSMAKSMIEALRSAGAEVEVRKLEKKDISVAASSTAPA